MSNPLTFLLTAVIALLFSVSGNADTRSDILTMENACNKKASEASTKLLASMNVKCRPYVDHGGAKTPDAIKEDQLSSTEQALLKRINQLATATIKKQKDELSALLTNNFVIIQPGGNAWDKQSYIDVGVAHLMTMFSEIYFEIEPIRIISNDDSATIIARFRLGGLHMGKPATTFGLSTITLSRISGKWQIAHIHNSGMQVY